jgi:hypothetical protein
MTEEILTDTGDGFELAKFDGDYAAAEVEKREPVPDGKYQVNVERVELTRSRTAGNPMLKWTLRILNGPHEGRCLWRHNMIVSPDNLKWLKTDLDRCGVAIEKLSSLGENLHRLLDIKLEVTKRTREENENVYLNRRIALAEVYEAAAGDEKRF